MNNEEHNESVAVAGEGLRMQAQAAYAQCGRESQEEKWILAHLPLVRHIVQRVASHLAQRMDVEDLISAGTLGLVKAARAFDPSKDVEFKTYAFIRVRGAVIDELRSRSFVPVNVHKQITRVQSCLRKLMSTMGRVPSDEELAAEVGVPLAQLYRLMEEVRKQHFLSIHGLNDDEPVLGAFAPTDITPGPQAEAEKSELLAHLAKAISEMPERDRTILLLYYERDLTMKETAQVLNLTESRVSQLHASALFKLSVKMRGAA